MLLALILGVIGFLSWKTRGPVLLGAAAALGSLAGLELSIREHFAGYKSHTSILAGTIAVGTLAALYFARVPQVVMLVVAAAVFATGFYAFREAFKRRAGPSASGREMRGLLSGGGERGPAADDHVCRVAGAVAGAPCVGWLWVAFAGAGRDGLARALPWGSRCSDSRSPWCWSCSRWDG